MSARVQPLMTMLRLLIAVIGMMQIALFAPAPPDGPRLVSSALTQIPEPSLQAHRPAQLAGLVTKLSVVAGAKTSIDPVVGVIGAAATPAPEPGVLLLLDARAHEDPHAQKGHHRPRARSPPVA